MMDPERTLGSEPPNILARDDELPHFAQKLGSFVAHMGNVCNANNPEQQYGVAFFVAQDLAWNLGFLYPGPYIPQKYDEQIILHAATLGVIPVIIKSPRLNVDQRAELIAGYPTALRSAGLFRLLWSAEREVRDYLLSDHVNEIDLLKPKKRRSEEAILYGIVTARWRRQRRERLLAHTQHVGNWLLGPRD